MTTWAVWCTSRYSWQDHLSGREAFQLRVGVVIHAARVSSVQLIGQLAGEGYPQSIESVLNAKVQQTGHGHAPEPVQVAKIRLEAEPIYSLDVKPCTAQGELSIA